MPSFFTLIPHFLSGIYKLFEHISVHSFRVPYISGGNTKEMDKKWTENEHIIAIKCVHANYFYVHVAYPYTLEHSVYNFAGIYQNIRKRFTHRASRNCFTKKRFGIRPWLHFARQNGTIVQTTHDAYGIIGAFCCAKCNHAYHHVFLFVFSFYFFNIKNSVFFALNGYIR